MDPDAVDDVEVVAQGVGMLDRHVLDHPPDSPIIDLTRVRPAGRYGHSLTRLSDGSVLIFGGTDETRSGIEMLFFGGISGGQVLDDTLGFYAEGAPPQPTLPLLSGESIMARVGALALVLCLSVLLRDRSKLSHFDEQS